MGRRKRKQKNRAYNPNEEKKEEARVETLYEANKEENDTKNSNGDIVLRVYLHCEGCANKVTKCLKGFGGVEDVRTDCENHKVIVKGKKADPMKVAERLRKKSNKHVELLSPTPNKKASESGEGQGKVEQKENKEEPKVTVVVLKMYMHCEGCAHEIKKCIQKMKGVLTVEPDMKKSLVTVKGEVDPPKLVEYIHKRAGKHAVIVKQQQEGKGTKNGKKREEDGDGTEAERFHYYYPPEFGNIQPHLIFSDENTQSCSVM